MQATGTRAIELLGSQNQFYIPIFQRAYSWEKKDCVRLLDNIVTMSNSVEQDSHFIGSIIYLKESNHVFQLSRCALIDGQQRLTTLSLVLIALADYSNYYYSKNDQQTPFDLSWDSIKNRYIINPYNNNEDYYKIKLGEFDFPAYRNLVLNRNADRLYNSNRLIKNYNDILSYFKRNNIEPRAIINGISKLKVVDIVLDDRDNAQAVFETVNSYGKDLRNFEKIKNYIFMQAPANEQESLYRDSWKKLEQYFNDNTDSGLDKFDGFIKHYLISKTKKKSESDIYEEFKYYHYRSSDTTAEILNNIVLYLSFYKKWESSSFDDNNEISNLLLNIKITNQDRFIPLILRVMDDYSNNRCSENNFKDVLKFVESYIIRRRICEIPNNSLTEACIMIIKKIEDIGYDDLISNCISAFTYAQRFPKDDELLEAVKSKKIYLTNRTFAKYLLEKVEKHFNKEFSQSSAFSIEHIMPQTLSDEWKTYLGNSWSVIYEKYLHTLGNLTLTGYNSEYSNYPFETKRDMENGFKQSTLRINSTFVALQNQWKEEEILAHAEWFNNIISQIWKYPIPQHIRADIL